MAQHNSAPACDSTEARCLSQWASQPLGAAHTGHLANARRPHPVTRDMWKRCRNRIEGTPNVALGSANQRKGLFSHILGPFPKKLRKCNSLCFTDLFLAVRLIQPMESACAHIRWPRPADGDMAWGTHCCRAVPRALPAGCAILLGRAKGHPMKANALVSGYALCQGVVCPSNRDHIVPPDWHNPC